MCHREILTEVTKSSDSPKHTQRTAGSSLLLRVTNYPVDLSSKGTSFLCTPRGAEKGEGKHYFSFQLAMLISDHQSSPFF